MLLIVGVLAFALEDSQKSNASTDSYNPDNPNDSPFSLPFDSDVADQSDDGDYQSDGGDYQSDDGDYHQTYIPFP